MIFYENEISNGADGVAKGSVCWLRREDVVKFYPKGDAWFNIQNPTHADMCMIRDRIRRIKERAGVEFYNETVYRYTLHKNGKLKEIGINYKDK